MIIKIMFLSHFFNVALSGFSVMAFDKKDLFIFWLSIKGSFEKWNSIKRPRTKINLSNYGLRYC